MQSTRYQLADGQILLHESAKERGGVHCEPVLLAEGKTCARVKPGETVHFYAKAVAPEGTGVVTAMDYDVTSDLTLSLVKKPLTVFSHKGNFTTGEEDGLATGELRFEHAYEEPGTYFASVRVSVSRTGDAGDYFTQVKNIARVRVIVEE